MSKLKTNESRKTKTNQAYIDGWELVAKVKVSAMQGNLAPLINDMRRQLEVSQRYDFADLVSEFSFYLNYYFLEKVGNRRRAKPYKILHEKYSYIAFVEKKVISTKSYYIQALNEKRSPSGELLTQFSEDCRELESYLSLDSITVKHHIYSLLTAEAALNHNYERVLGLCKEIIAEMDARGIQRTAHFYKDAAVVLMLLKRNDEASELIQRALNSISKGKGSWAIFAYYQVVNQLQAGNYDEAFRLYELRHRTKIINRALKEEYLILKGFFKFLSDKNLIKGQHSFKLAKFLNSVPVFDKDKSGHNINILLLKALTNGDDWIIRNEENIRLYMSRYMRSSSLNRAKLLLRFLIAYAKYSYNNQAIDRHVKPIFEKLIGADLTYQHIELEIIPYDVIARIVMNPTSTPEESVLISDQQPQA